MFRQKAVLPMEGRPAMMMRSLAWNPEVSLSRSMNPVASPVIISLRSKSCSMVLKLPWTMSLSDENGSVIFLSEISRMRCCAWSMSSSILTASGDSS